MKPGILILASSSRNFPLDVEQILQSGGYASIKLPSINEFISCPERSKPFLTILEIGNLEDIDRALIAFEWAERVQPLAPVRFLILIASRNISLGERASKFRGAEVAQLPLPAKNLLFKLELQLKLLNVSENKEKKQSRSGFTPQLKFRGPNRSRVMVLRGPNIQEGIWRPEESVPTGTIRWRWIQNSMKEASAPELQWILKSQTAHVFNPEDSSWETDDEDAEIECQSGKEKIFSASAKELKKESEESPDNPAPSKQNQVIVPVKVSSAASGILHTKIPEIHPDIPREKKSPPKNSDESSTSPEDSGEKDKKNTHQDSHKSSKEKVAENPAFPVAHKIEFPGIKTLEKRGLNIGTNPQSAGDSSEIETEDKQEQKKTATAGSSQGAAHSGSEAANLLAFFRKKRIDSYGHLKKDKTFPLNNRLKEKDEKKEIPEVNNPTNDSAHQQNSQPPTQTDSERTGEIALTQKQKEVLSENPLAKAEKNKKIGEEMEKEIYENPPKAPALPEREVNNFPQKKSKPAHNSTKEKSDEWEKIDSAKKSDAKSETDADLDPSLGDEAAISLKEAPESVLVTKIGANNGDEENQQIGKDGKKGEELHTESRFHGAKREDFLLEKMPLKSSSGGPSEQRIFFILTLKDLDDKNSTWYPVEGYRIYLAADYRYYGAKKQENVFPLWVYEGELAPAFLEKDQAWKFYDRLPDLYPSVENLPEPVLRFLQASIAERAGKPLHDRRKKITSRGPGLFSFLLSFFDGKKDATDSAMNDSLDPSLVIGDAEKNKEKTKKANPILAFFRSYLFSLLGKK